MPVGIVFGKGDALAFDGVADDGGWAVRSERQASEHIAQRIDVVPIDIDGGEIERLPLVEQGLEILDFAGRAGRLDLIVVNYGGEIGKLVLAGAERRLPH